MTIMHDHSVQMLRHDTDGGQETTFSFGVALYVYACIRVNAACIAILTLKLIDYYKMSTHMGIRSYLLWTGLAVSY